MPVRAIGHAGATPATVPQSWPRALAAPASRIAPFWPRLLLSGLGTMFAGWMIHTDAFVNAVNGTLLVTGVVAVLIFAATKHPAALGIGIITLGVRYAHLLDWAVNAIWTWLIIAGLCAVMVGGATRIVTHEGIVGRTAIGAVLLTAGLWSFLVVSGYEIPPLIEALPGFN